MRHARAAAGTLWTALRLFIDDQGLSWAGAIGLYLFLSVPPLMVATTYAVTPFLPEGSGEAFIVEQVAKYLPAQQDLLEGIVRSAPPGVLATLGTIALLLFSGSRAFAALTSAINVMWRRVDRLTFVRRQALRLAMLLVTFALMGVAALGEGAVALVAGANGGDVWLLDWQIIPSVLLAVFLFAAYKLLPREPVSALHAFIGAAFGTVGIRLSQALVGWLSARGTFRTPYGDLADIALMASWALIIGVIILYGAALVAVLDGKRPIDHEADERFARSEG